MPDRAVELPVRRVFSGEEMARLREGLVPEEMEDRWFVVWTGEALDFHRSWTGAHIFRMSFAPARFGEEVASVIVNRDPEQYRSEDIEADAGLVLWLCDALVLGYERGRPPRAPRITLDVGDITKTGCDVVVNAANAGLAGGGGVDGAIHRAAGRALVDACRELPTVERGIRCPTGEARVTPGFALPGARWIVHAVGPVHGTGDDARLLRAAFDAAFDAAVLHGGMRVAVPAISCGAFGYPLAEAARIAVDAARAARELDEIRFVLFDEKTRAAWARALERLEVTRSP